MSSHFCGTGRGGLQRGAELWKPRKSRSPPRPSVFSRDEDYTTDVREKKDSKIRYRTPSHVETKNSASQFLSLCHVYYCNLTASAREKNNYGNKDFSERFKTIFKIILSATASESLPSAAPGSPKALQTRGVVCPPHITTQLGYGFETELCCIHASAGIFGAGRDGGRARFVEAARGALWEGLPQRDRTHKQNTPVCAEHMPVVQHEEPTALSTAPSL